MMKDYDYEMSNQTNSANSNSINSIPWRQRTFKRSWMRLPRSFKIYLVIGLIIVVAIVTFSTSKMLPVLASNQQAGFPFILATRSTGTETNLMSFSAPSASNQHHMPIHSSTWNPNVAHHPPIIDNIHHAISAAAAAATNGQPSLSNSGQQTIRTPSTRSLPPTSDTARTLLAARPIINNLFFPSYNSSSSTNNATPQTTYDDPRNKYRRNFIRNMMKHAWDGYVKHAWGYNEVRPVTGEINYDSVFGSEKTGATIVDGIDTLYIMGLMDEYKMARDWIEHNLDLGKYDFEMSVFETNIRYVGGLLSMFAMTKDKMFLDKAVQVANKLLPAFNTPSGVPYSSINSRTGYATNHGWSYGAAILSEFGTMHLEFMYLSHVTGDPEYANRVQKVRDVIKGAIPRADGLYNNYMNTDSGQWLVSPVHVSMGALGDSFYEYLIKSYVYSGDRDTDGYNLYIEAIKAFENKLVFTSSQSRLVYFAELKGTSINHKMGSLACFSGGMLALGATKSSDPRRHMKLAADIANTCHESCVRTKSKIGPETFVFSNQAEAIAFGPQEKYYILRPEILETYFYLWRYTHDPKYREWAWDFAQSIEKYCKSEAGYSGLRNVYDPNTKDDVQQSFFLAEVLKYLYLIFSDDNLINLNDWVLNTEAHPFPIMKNISFHQQ